MDGVKLAAIIKTVDLRKVYRVGTEKVVALGCINLEIEEGQVCCILGTSGSGKSTLLNQLAGLEKPTRGEVYILGKNVSKMTEKQLAHFRQKHIGFVFQSYNLLPGMTAIENVAMPLTFRGVSKRKREAVAKKMLEAVGLGERMKHTPAEMSGGQQQRVGIARAFAAHPQVVFADEPTGNLDTKTTKEVMELFLNFSRQQNITIVLVTHDRSLANYADRIVTIVDGAVVGDTPNKSLFDLEREEAARQAAWENDQLPPVEAPAPEPGEGPPAAERPPEEPAEPPQAGEAAAEEGPLPQEAPPEAPEAQAPQPAEPPEIPGTETAFGEAEAEKTAAALEEK